MVALQSWRPVRPAATEFSCLGLLLQRLLARVWGSRSCWLGPVPAEVADLGLDLQRLLSWASSTRGRWLRPASSDAPGSGTVPQRSLVQACSLRGHSLIPAPAEVAGSADRVFSKKTYCGSQLWKCIFQKWYNASQEVYMSKAPWISLCRLHLMTLSTNHSPKQVSFL